MNKSRLLLIAAAVLAFAAVSCQKDNSTQSVPGESSGWIERPDGFRDRYALEEMVVLSRHNIRSPLSGGGSVLARLTPHQWFSWTSAPSELSVKGGELEAIMGGFFRQWLISENLIPAKGLPKDGAIRIYANSMQRTKATAGFFAGTLLPSAEIEPEVHYSIGTMDPVFNPVTTNVDDAFRKEALSQIAALGGDAGMAGLGAKVSREFKILENVIDIKQSPAAENDTTAFKTDDVVVTITEGKEPSMKGGLKSACSVSDALVLQYYEDTSDLSAGFGHTLSFNDWISIASVKDWYQDILFTTPAIACNVSKPLLKEILSELQTEGRKFAYLCGHDSNVGSVLAALDCEEYLAPNAIERKTPIGCKVVFEKWLGPEGKEYVDIFLVYASSGQIRYKSNLTLNAPPIAFPVRLKGILANRDGLYTLEDLTALFKAVISED